MIELMKLPIPEPSVVLVPEIVGFWLVLQHTPLDVTAAPPSLVIVPPLEAVVEVMLETIVVEIMGIILGGSFLQLKVIIKRRQVMTTEKTENFVFMM